MDPVVSACVSTVGIYAVCNALSPEEPRHYNQHKTKTIGQQNRDLTLWRFGFRVRENKSVRLVAPSATGLNKNVGKMVRDHVRQRAVRILFSDIVNKAVWEPTPDCAQKYNVHVFSLS